MRDIEYRGKTVKNKKWVFGYYSKLAVPSGKTLRNTYNISTGSARKDGNKWIFETIDVYPNTVGQCTGFTDITNTKWYQHDIIGEKVPEYVIDYDSSKAMFNAFYINPDGTYDDAYEGDLSMLLKGCKVFGNIHDNPELLQRD